MGEDGAALCGQTYGPGSNGSDNRLFVEAVLWIARTASLWRYLPLFFGNWNSVFKRYRDWVKSAFSSDCTRPAQTSRIWNTTSSMPPSSKSIATVRAQKGDAEPGDRPLEARHDDQNTRADRRARQSGGLLPAAWSPFRYGRCLSADRRIAFGGLIADKAFDSNAIIANFNERGAKIVISQHARRVLPLRLDTELYKWRHLIENFFCSSRNSNVSRCGKKKEKASKLLSTSLQLLIN